MESSLPCLSMSIIHRISMCVIWTSCFIDIASGTITGTMPRRALKMVYEWLDLHQDELMDNWNRLQRGEEFRKIDPLD